MQPPVVIIPARSEKQAMDWSLVLVSQGIETAIERDPERGEWGLAVGGAEYEQALRTLEQYRAENRGRRWRLTVPGTGMIFDWRSILWFVLLAAFFAFNEFSHERLKEIGLMDTRAVRAGEWWRLFTATMLHADIAHLMLNATIGTLLLGLAMGGYGGGLALLVGCFSGIAGNAAGFLLYGEPHLGLGASGFVLGTLGMVTTESLSALKTGPAPGQIIGRALMAGTLLLVLLGFSSDPKTDVLAHVAGFMAGALGGGCLALLPAAWVQARRVDAGAQVACAALVVVTWYFALTKV